MTQTYFNYPLSERYTWYSGDNKTKKVLDYVLVEPFVQQYIKDCQVSQEFDFESDHRLIVTSLETPKTKKVRRKHIQISKAKKLDISALKKTETAELFAKEVSRKINNGKQGTTTEISTNIIDTLKAAAEATLPSSKSGTSKEIWRDDGNLNGLLKQRALLSKNDTEYKHLTRLIKK